MLCATLLVAPSALSRPNGPALFCAEYPESASCAGTLPSCALCHTSTSPDSVGWNAYGFELLAQYSPPFELGLGPAVTAVDPADTDGDGYTNGAEIGVASDPSDPTSRPANPAPPHGAPNPRYALDSYDPRFAFKRVSIAFCGVSPSYEQMQAFDAAPDPVDAVHARLDECLAGEYWRDSALPRLADPLVRPIDFGSNFSWDYRLFRYVMTGDRDVRELLLATYHVAEPASGQFQVVEGVIDGLTGVPCDTETPCAPGTFCAVELGQCVLSDGAQKTLVSDRAGMLTTTWFHFYNTMFSALPRQTAAQAYRAYAGMDLARLEGVHPDPDWAGDIDQSGVEEAECAQCHETLDPLAYEFAFYNGIGEPGGEAFRDPNRPSRVGLWEPENRPQGRFLGEPVDSLRDFAEQLAASAHFRRTVANWLWRYALRHEVRPEEQPEFSAVWGSFGQDDDWTARALIHAIVATDAFGAP